MKRLIFFAAVIVLMAAMRIMPFQSTDVAKLQPVQVIRIDRVPEGFLVETDTGSTGLGDSVKAAFANLKDSAAGEVFWETAEYLLVGIKAVRHLPEAMPMLRPACNVCLELGRSALEEVAAFLDTHDPGVTLTDYRTGEYRLPVLVIEEGRMRLEQ